MRSTITAFLVVCILKTTFAFELLNVSPRTCVIGAGYSGLATAKYLKEYNIDFTVFEASQFVGGIWHFDSRVGVDEDGIPIFTQAYKSLRTNTPYLFTEFHDFPFPEGTSSHPSSDCLWKYLTVLATRFGLLEHIQFRTLVTSVKRFGNKWQLTYWRGDTKMTVTETCDYVVVATGKYNDPVWPQIQGADIFQGNITHSFTYRYAEVYRNRRVLIVGAGASGIDLAIDISQFASKLVHSYHNIFRSLPLHGNYVKKPDIKTFTHNGVIFNDGSFEEVDDVIYCTGYSNWHPFLDDSSGLIRTKKFVMPLYRYIVNINHPSMLFVGAIRMTLQKVLAAQGNYVASLIAGRFQLPSQDEMMKIWVDEVNYYTHNIGDIDRLYPDKLVYYCGNLTLEAGIPTFPPVFYTMAVFHDFSGQIIDIFTFMDYDWNIIDDHSFEWVYDGPKEMMCPIHIV